MVGRLETLGGQNEREKTGFLPVLSAAGFGCGAYCERRLVHSGRGRDVGDSAASAGTVRDTWGDIRAHRLRADPDSEEPPDPKGWADLPDVRFTSAWCCTAGPPAAKALVHSENSKNWPLLVFWWL